MSSPENIHAEDMPFETNGVDIRVGRQMWTRPVEYDGRSQDDVTSIRKGGFQQLLAVLLQCLDNQFENIVNAKGSKPGVVPAYFVFG